MSMRLKARLSSPTTGWLKSLTAEAWKRTLWTAQCVRNASLLVASSPTRSDSSRSFAPGGRAQDLGGGSGGFVPVGVEGLGARVEEAEPREVRRPGRCGVQLGEQRASKRVGGEDVEAVVADVGGGAGDRIERPLDLRPDPRLGRAPTLGRAGRVGGASEVEEVRALGVVELERPGECFQHAFGDAAEVSTLQAGVVRDADAGQDGDLFTAQPRDASRAVRRHAGLLGGDRGAT